MHYFDTGFTVREPAWHGLGKVADRYPADWDEAREWAGLTWEPTEAPAYEIVSGSIEDAEQARIFAEDAIRRNDPLAMQAALQRTLDVTPRMQALPDHKRITRSDTGATLGVTGKGYTVISHAEMGEVMQAMLDETGVKYETAGSIKGGAHVWALAYLDEPVVLPGDNSVTLPFMALSNRHDGTGSLRLLPTSVRIVCANTVSAAEAQGERNGTVFTFRHGANWRDRIEEAKAAVRGVRDEFAALSETAQALVKIPVTREQTETFITTFIPAPPDLMVSDRVARNVEEARNAVRTILAGPTTETISGTAWGLVSAAGEYLDHYRRSRSAETHMARQLLRAEPFKAKAVQLVREVVSV